ncbi:hypothetical protein TCAL_15513 [Tigriopus californicus]|uniref:Uncharacterized protein n=1 Tax=Tigriopus californicus TaxID=6832 RepID=A0A553PS29_TIGCA|nr:hypothetical protein TCAL_15513 [Tigriopus californicus]
MASSLDSKWATKLNPKHSDIKQIKKDSALRQPLEFLMFLNVVSRQKGAFDLSVEQLQGIKRATLGYEEQPPALENDKSPAISCLAKSSCSMALSCNEDDSSNLPRRFETNEDFNDKLTNAVNLGRDESTHSIQEGRNKLWNREYSPDQQTISEPRLIPEEFLEKIHDIPPEFKDSCRTVKQIISSCERISRSIPENDKKSNQDNNTASTFSVLSLLQKMTWALLLIDVWQSDQKLTRESLWQEDHWLDILTAPLFKDGSDSNSILFKLQSHLKKASYLDIQSFLNDYQSTEKHHPQITKAQKAKPQSKTKVQQETLTKFLKSDKLFLGTFFTAQVLGLTGSQCEAMVQKNGTLLGDLFEKNVFQALKKTLSMHSKWIAVFCGLEVLGGKQGKNEFDYLIILGQVKKIIYVECKNTLGRRTAKKIKKQSNNAFEYLQKHLPTEKGWEFLTWACFGEMLQTVAICSSCQPYLVQISTIGSSLDKILKERANDVIENGINGINNKVFEDLVKTFLFHALINKQIFEGGQVAKHQMKRVDFPGQSIILWNLHQLKILHKDPCKMIIKSHGQFGSGKTEILKTKATKLAQDGNNCVLFLVARPLQNFVCHDNFEIEDGLVLNLRNSEEIQKMIPFIQEYRSLNTIKELDNESIENLISVLEQENNAKQILVIFPNIFHQGSLKKMSKIANAKFYGFPFHYDMKNCSDEDLRLFLDASNTGEKRILVTFEYLVEGFEAEMVLFPKWHNLTNKSTLFRGKAKLETANISKFAHPMLQKQKSVPKSKEKLSVLVPWDLDIFSISDYPRFRPSPDSKVTVSNVNYYKSYEIHNINDWRSKFEQSSSIKQYNLVVQATTTEKMAHPLCILLEMNDEWRTSYCLDVDKEDLLQEYHPLKSLMDQYDKEIVELILTNQIRHWSVWKNIMIAQIIFSHRQNLELRTRFNYRQMFSLWSRIHKEFHQEEYILDQRELDDKSYDLFRRKVLKENLFIRKYRIAYLRVKLPQAILESFVVDPQFQHWNTIDLFVEWLRSDEFDSTVIDFFISREFPHHVSKKTEGNDDPQAHLRQELSSMFRYGRKSPKLNVQPISMIWEHETFCRFRDVLEDNFPSFVKKSWFLDLVSAEKECKNELRNLRATKGSIYLQQQEEQNDTTFEGIPPRSRAVFVGALIFLACQTSAKNSRQNRNRFERIWRRIKSKTKKWRKKAAD